MPVTLAKIASDEFLTLSKDSEALNSQLNRLVDELTLSKEQLITISDRFVEELEEGLHEEGKNLPMNPTWVFGYPTGREKGVFLALDMGGTNVRIVEVILDGNRGYETKQERYKMDESLKSDSKDHLFGFLADAVLNFLKNNHTGDWRDELKLGFTFSFPLTQSDISHGILQRWTKGFNVKDVENHEVVSMLEYEFKKRDLNIKVAAIINDTTGTLIASNYTNPRIKMGCIFGTGINAAYMEHIRDIPKIAKCNFEPSQLLAINCEYGAFDNAYNVLPLTEYDKYIDKHSPRPGQQAYEKMIAGFYLGELFRLIIKDLYNQKIILKGQNISKVIDKEYVFDTSVLTIAESDVTSDLSQTNSFFKKNYDIDFTLDELKFVVRLSRLIGTRAARLSHVGIAAVMKKKKIYDCDVGADGSVFNKYPDFKERGSQALIDILGQDWGSKINVVSAEDGSGVGAAVIAAMNC